MRREKSKLRRRTERALTRCVAASFGFLARFLPLSALRGLADGFAWAIRKLAPSRQGVAVENLRRAFGDRYTNRQYRALAASVTRGICRTMVELLKLPYLSAEQIQDLVDLRGAEHVEAALALGKGVLMLTAHFGNWEFGGARMARAGWPVTVVARDSEENLTAQMINQARRSQGLEVLDRDSLRGMLRTLESGRILCVLADQHAATGGIIVDFLGRPAATATGPAVLALRTGAAIVPGFCHRLADGTFRVEFFPALDLPHTGDRDADVRKITQMCNDVVAREITADPDQWLWLHRRWKVDHLAEAPPPVESETHG